MTVMATKVEIDMAGSSENPFNRFKSLNQGGTTRNVMPHDYISHP